MKKQLLLFSALLCGLTAMQAQTTILEEDFETGEKASKASPLTIKVMTISITGTTTIAILSQRVVPPLAVPTVLLAMVEVTMSSILVQQVPVRKSCYHQS